MDLNWVGEKIIRLPDMLLMLFVNNLIGTTFYIQGL